MTRPIVLAVPKGRILEEAAEVFGRAGHDLSPVLGDSRRLMHDCGALRVLVLRSSDIATYVAHGAADVGVAGSDVLDEEGRDLFEPLDLGIGRCRMIVAERADAPVDERALAHLRVATKYPRTTRAYLQRKNVVRSTAPGPFNVTRRGAGSAGRSRAQQRVVSRAEQPLPLMKATEMPRTNTWVFHRFSRRPVAHRAPGPPERGRPPRAAWPWPARRPIAAGSACGWEWCP